MSETTAGLLQVAVLLAALAVCYRPLGGYMGRVYSSEHHTRVERAIYRAVGVDPCWPSRRSACSSSTCSSGSSPTSR